MPGKATTCKEAIARFEAANGVVTVNAEKVELFGVCPPIEKMDAALGTLKLCKQLSLSTNSIEKIGGLSGMAALQTLSLARNLIRKVEGLEPVAGTLEQLWLSYNQLERLTGLEGLPALRVLYLGNNKLRDWAEVERLAALPALQELLLAGNPLHGDYTNRGAVAEYRIEVLKRLPKLKKLDGLPVDPDEREAAAKPTAK